MSSSEQFPVENPDEEWRRELSPEAYNVLRAHGTERAGSSPLVDEHRAGMFRCAACGQELFSSDTKFDSGSGWPSFFKPLLGDGSAPKSRPQPLRCGRTEVHCARCGSHLGHVFPDGPQPTGRALLREHAGGA